MADVFISYARADRERVEVLAATLEAHGHAVWRDRQILGGDDFVANIERELNAAKAVIVAWSIAGFGSHHVFQALAHLGLGRLDESEAHVERGKTVWPGSLDDYRLNLKRWFYPQPELLERLKADLRIAGMDFL